jgi:hypothetical protein
LSHSADLRRLVKPHLDNLNQLFNQSISASRLDSQTYLLNPSQHLIARRVNGQLARLELHPGTLEFSQIITERGGRAHVLEATYIYWLTDDHWAFRYEYDVQPEERKPHSHLHVNAQTPFMPDLPKIHFPAGRLSVEHLIFHLVTEHRVKCALSLAQLVNELRRSFERWERTDLALFP